MKKINIANILKNCPSGMELDCAMYEGIEFDSIINVDNDCFPIRCRIKNSDGGYNVYYFTKYGYWNNDRNAKCVIFPKGKTSWEGFQKPFKSGDVLYIDGTEVTDDKRHEYIFILDGIYHGEIHSYCHYYIHGGVHLRTAYLADNKYPIRFATEKEKQKLFQAIKENGYKWNAETKTLEKLVEPKFKVGDRVESIYNNIQYDIKEITDTHYTLVGIEDNYKYSEPLAADKNYRLVPNKFNINTLVPFESRVLARDNEREKWIPAFWGFYDVNSDYPYKLIGCIARYCIPYEGNEHLCGKTDDCNKYFKTWK